MAYFSRICFCAPETQATRKAAQAAKAAAAAAAALAAAQEAESKQRTAPSNKSKKQPKKQQQQQPKAPEVSNQPKTQNCRTAYGIYLIFDRVTAKDRGRVFGGLERKRWSSGPPVMLGRVVTSSGLPAHASTVSLDWKIRNLIFCAL